MTQLTVAEIPQLPDLTVPTQSQTTAQPELDLSPDAAIGAIQYYYRGLIKPEALKEEVIIERVSIEGERVTIEFHGWLGTTGQEIYLALADYKAVTQPVVEEEDDQQALDNYLREHEAFVKPISNVLPNLDIYKKVGLCYKRIGQVGQDPYHRWLATERHGFGVTMGQPSKYDAIVQLIQHHYNNHH